MREADREERRVAMMNHTPLGGIALSGLAAMSLASMGARMQVKSSRIIEHEPLAPDAVDLDGIDLTVDGLVPAEGQRAPTREEMMCSTLMSALPGVYLCELKQDSQFIKVTHHSGQSVEIPIAEVEKILELAEDAGAIRLRVAQYYAAQRGIAQPTTADQNALAQANAKRDRKAAKRKELLCRSP